MTRSVRFWLWIMRRAGVRLGFTSMHLCGPEGRPPKLLVMHGSDVGFGGLVDAGSVVEDELDSFLASLSNDQGN